MEDGRGLPVDDGELSVELEYGLGESRNDGGGGSGLLGLEREVGENHKDDREHRGFFGLRLISELFHEGDRE